MNGMLVERWLPAGGTESVLKTDLFDELAGPGLYPVLDRRAARVVGIDISTTVVERAGVRYPQLERAVADVRALPFEDDSFDAVFSNSTLDHFRTRGDVAVALGELHRVLRPGGRLVVTLDNPFNPAIVLRSVLPARLSAAVRGVDYELGWTCGPRTLRRMLAETGFDVREMTAVVHFPRVLAAVAGWRSRLVREWAGWPSLFGAAERLERLPTRYLTGHFVASLSVRRADA